MQPFLVLGASSWPTHRESLAYFSRILTGFGGESLLNLLPSSYWSQAPILPG